MDIKLKKIVKRTFFVLLGIILFLFLSCYFILHYRIKYVIRQIVRIETNDAYDIDFSDLSLSLLSGHVKIKDASFYSKKADSSQATYQVRVSEFYFSLKSWRPLFSQRRLIVDSLYIGQPEIRILQFKEAGGSHKTAFELHSVYEILTQTAANLNVRVLQIKEAAIYLYPSDSSSYSLKIDHINFRIANFEKRQKDATRFLLSDDVDLRIRNQHWVLPSGNSIDFSNLHFSGKDQHFEIDSCLLKTADKGSGNSVKIQASKFFFTSSHLTSAYLEEKLLIDTLSCINPVVQLRSGNENEPRDTVSFLAQSLTKIFEEVHFKYINVVDGQLSLLKKDDDQLTNYQSQRANLRLYDLDIHSGNPSSFSLRDIEFELDTIRFLSPDSSYVLNVGRFSINDGDLICENATFVPFKKEDISGGMRLTLPQITLKNISLEELLQKRLKATYAQFNNPDIFISGGRLLKNKNKRKVKVVDALYAALHGFSSLINVEIMYINHGKLHYLSGDNNVTVSATNMTAAIGLNDLFQSDSLVNIKTALRQMSFDALTLKSPQLRLDIKNVNTQGTTRGTHVNSAVIDLTNEMSIKANQIFWSKLDWDVLYNQKKIEVDRVSFGRLDVQYIQAALNAETPHKRAPFFASNSFYIEDLTAAIALRNGTKLNTKGNSLLVSNIRNDENGLEWEDIKSRFENSIYSKAGIKITAEASLLDKQKGSILKNVTISANKNEFWLPEVKLATTINNTKLSNLHLQYLVINEPTISVNSDGSGNDQDETRIPFNLNVDKMEINKAKIGYRSKPVDSLRFTALANVTVDSLQMLKDGTNTLSYPLLRMQLTNAEIVNKKIVAGIPEVNISLSQSALHKTPKGKQGFKADAKLQWINASIKRADSSEYVQQTSNLSGEFTYPALYIEAGKKMVLRDLIDQIKINNGSLFYSNAARTIIVDKLTLDVNKGNLEMENIHIKPNMSRDTFFKTSEWQKDYTDIRCGKVSLDNFDIRKYLEDSAVDIQDVTVENASVVTSRDKTISFEHGIEKLMPTKLIQSIKRPFHIQRVIVQNANITSNEISLTTKKEGSVPFISVNGEIRNINNNPSPADSLSVYANAVFLDHHIRTLLYRESYTDSLSGFHMVVKISPMDLTALSKISIPLVAVEVEKGKSDTLFERIAGNKYAAFGEMKFYYHGLKIKTLDPIDTAKKNLVLSFKNFAVNKFIIKTNNKRYSSIFFIRDQERFIFNYWVKTTLSGVITSTGIKNNKKYLKQYDKVKDGYSLPSWE